MLLDPESVAVAHVRLDGRGLDAMAAFALPVRGPRFFWSSMDRVLTLGAVGSVAEVRAAGPERWVALEAVAGHPSIAASVGDEAHPPDRGPEVRWVGGFAYFDAAPGGPWSGFPAAWLYLPRATLTVVAGEAWLSVLGAAGEKDALAAQARRMADQLQGSAAAASPLPPGDSAGARVPAMSAADRRALAARVRRAVATVRGGAARKVVVATQRSISLDPALSPELVLARLRAAQPGCSHYLVAPRPGLALVGATPERLVAVRGASLETMALAGSAPRGAEPDEDRRLGEALLASAKDRAEHALVVDAIRRDLATAVDTLAVPEMPHLRRLTTIQHLETSISGLLAGQSQGQVLDFARRLHPTPALGGEPREAALAVIRGLEGETRGWFGGGVGWASPSGDGDLSVAIRCVLLHDGQATAFAGAGIVAESEVEREVAEIELKLGVALGAVVGRG